MSQVIGFIIQFKYLSLGMLVSSFVLSRIIADKALAGSRLINEAMGGRNEKKSLYGRCISFIKYSVKEYENRKKSGFYDRIKVKMKRSGYKGEYAAVIYLLLKFAAPVFLFTVSFIANYPSVKKSLLLALLTFLIVDIVVKIEKKKHNMIFQKHIYKIYKYLHNQISSGVRVTDAVKTVYEVVEDNVLKEILIRLAARFELTLDIDASLDEFRMNFDLHEVETLCVALKQGVITGDNRELLARQEEVMFSKYFNYIQAETDGLRMRSTIVVAMFCAVIVIMIAVPLFKDVMNAVGHIFTF